MVLCPVATVHCMSTDRRPPTGLETLLEALHAGFAEPKPRDLRAQIAAALGTTDRQAIVAAIADYVGTYEHAEEYVARNLVELLPPGFGWLVHCCDPCGGRRSARIRVTAEVSTVDLKTAGAHCSLREPH